MKIMSIAFEFDPDKSRIVLKKINLNDKKISSLVTKLANKK